MSSASPPPTSIGAFDDPTSFGWREPAALVQPARYRAALVLLALVMLIVGLSGSATVPPEGHDVYSAQTTYEMHQRGSWLVPYFNGVPRLNKPPLGYWLTAAVAFVTGAGDDITVWHARVGSVLAALGVVMATVMLGRRLFGPSIGLLGGFIVATAHGAATMAHSGRPDMLYAALCSWQFVSFIEAYYAPDKSWRQRLWAWGSWVAFGLATLAKGPHVPGMFLGLAIIWLIAFRAGWGRSLRVIRPIAGLPLAALIAVPWFIYIREVVKSADLSSSVTGGDELGGSDLSVSWRNALQKPWFFPLQLLRMMIPWVVFVPGALVVCLARGPAGRIARLFAGALIVMMVVFSFGRLQRAHYLVPVMSLTGLLMAVGVAHTGWRPKDKRGLAWVWPVLVVGHLAGGVALVAWAVSYDVHRGEPARWLTLFIGADVAVAVAIIFLALRKQATEPIVFADHYGPFALTLIIAVAMGLAMQRAALWQGDRYPSSEFAQKVVQYKEETHTRLVTYGFPQALVTYYNREPVPLYQSADALLTAMRESPDVRFAIVINAEAVDELSSRMKLETVMTEDVPKGETKQLLVVGSVATAR